MQQAKKKAETAARRAILIQQKPWLAPGLTPTEKRRIRRRSCPERIAYLRSYKKLRGKKQENAVRKAAMTGSWVKGFTKDLGYTAAQLRRHIELLFDPGMTWEKFAAGEIHIDHRLPLASFDLTNREEFLAAWALTNLQPLWAEDNVRKGAQRLVLI